MNIEDAQRFVQKMRVDTGFRRSVTGFGGSSELWNFLKRSGFEFDPCDLVKAMAACMAESENASEKGSIDTGESLQGRRRHGSR